MNDSACTDLEHAKARLIRLEHRLQQATTRMHAAAQSGTEGARADYRDADAAAGRYRSQLQAAIGSVVEHAGECESLGSDPELLEEDIELAHIAGNLALDGDEVVPFTEDEDFMAAESAASGFGSDIVYRAHLDPLTEMLVAAGYDIMDVSPDARMEAQLRELEDAGFLGDFGASVSLPRSRKARVRLKRRLRRQKTRLGRRVRRLSNRKDPIGRDIYRAARTRLRRVKERLEAVTASLTVDTPTAQRRSGGSAGGRMPRRSGGRAGRRSGRSRRRSDGRRGTPSWLKPKASVLSRSTQYPTDILTGPTAILPSMGYPTSTPTDFADLGIPIPSIAMPRPSPRTKAIDPNHPDYQDLLNAPWTPDLARHHDYPDWVAVQQHAGRKVPGVAGGTKPYTPGGTPISSVIYTAPGMMEAISQHLQPARPGRRIPTPGRHATPEVLEAPNPKEFSGTLQGAATIAEINTLIARIRGAIRKSRGLSLRYQSRLKRDKGRAAQIRRRITRARRRSRSLIQRKGTRVQARRRQLASIISRLVRRLARVNDRIMDHTRLLALAARAVPAYQGHLKRAQAKIAALRASQAIQLGDKQKADAEAAKKQALEQDADVKEAAAEIATKVSNTTVVAADNEALRDAAEGAQAELATKAEAGASGEELAELSQLVALLTEAINSQIPGLITAMGDISRLDLTPVFVAPVVPDPDVKPPAIIQAPTAILPPGPAAPLTAPTDIADVGIPIPPVTSGLSAYEIATGATRPYQVHAVTDPVGMAAESYQDEREARLNAQLAMLATHGVDIGGDFGADTSFLDSHAPVGLWEDGAVDQFESGDVNMGADPWDQFGYTLGGPSGFQNQGRYSLTGSGPSYSSQLNTASSPGAGAGTATAPRGAAKVSFTEVAGGIGTLAQGIGGFLGNILPWVTGNQNQPAPAPQTVSHNQVQGGQVATQMPPQQVIYTPGQSQMATGGGGYNPPAEEKNYTPLYVAGGLGLVGLGVFAWASSR